MSTRLVDGSMRAGDAPRRVAAVAAAALVACALGAPGVRADIYTWTDASGRVNVSNLKPPDGANVTRVYHEDPDAAARVETARQAARDAELRTLAARVQQLEREADSPAQRAQPPVVYVAPVPVAYPVFVAPPVDPYAYTYAEPAPRASGCDVTLYDCTTWWWPGYYPAGAVVGAAPYGHRPPPYGYGYRYVGAPAPWQPLRPVAPGYGDHSGHGARPPHAGQPGGGAPPGNGDRPAPAPSHPMAQAGAGGRGG